MEKRRKRIKSPPELIYRVYSFWSRRMVESLMAYHKEDFQNGRK